MSISEYRAIGSKKVFLNTLAFTASNKPDTNYIYAYDKDGVRIGKLFVYTYQKQTKNVVLVRVNGAKIDKTITADGLNKIFKPAVTEFIISEDKIEIPDLKNFTHGGSNWHSVYNSDQKLVLETYDKNIKDDNFYLFFVDNVLDKKDSLGTSVSGYMPRGYNCGFIYEGGSLHTVAHELGHGVGNLEHAFSASNSSGKTQNLMDYSTGEELYHFQWNEIQDPSRVWMKWRKEESEGESVEGEHLVEYFVFSPWFSNEFFLKKIGDKERWRVTQPEILINELEGFTKIELSTEKHNIINNYNIQIENNTNTKKRFIELLTNAKTIAVRDGDNFEECNIVMVYYLQEDGNKYSINAFPIKIPNYNGIVSEKKVQNATEEYNIHLYDNYKVSKLWEECKFVKNLSKTEFNNAKSNTPIYTCVDSYGKLQNDDFSTNPHTYSANDLLTNVSQFINISDKDKNKLFELDKYNEEEIKSFYENGNMSFLWSGLIPILGPYYLYEGMTTKLLGTNDVLSEPYLSDVKNAFYNKKLSKDYILSYDENTKLSKDLHLNLYFQKDYYHDLVINYIHENINNYEMLDKIATEIKKCPNFSKPYDIMTYNFFGLFGGTQKIIYELQLFNNINEQKRILVDLKITIKDMYCSDTEDFFGDNKFDFTKKHNQLCMNAFFLLQHKFGCSPFQTEVIFHDYLEFKLD